MIIAIDGPAGSGKTTVSRRLAKRLGFFYLDTGAMYRALTLKCARCGIDPDNTQAAVDIARETSVQLQKDKVFLDGEDVTEEIRKPYINESISKIAGNPEVREVMVTIQRRTGQGKDCVVEGRDITTVVFPGARYRFYLDADVSERVGRRHKELREKGIGISKDELAASVRNRDAADMNRQVGALKKGEGVVSVDTTSLTIDQVVETLAAYITRK